MTELSAIAQPLAAALAARGYETLTPVQQAMLGDNAQGADLLVSAQTGSGKTVAFGIAIAPSLLDGQDRFDAPGAPLALIIAPTRELAIQVKRELEWLYADAGAKLATCVGGMDMRNERRALSQGAHIVVGTPGRLRDHITRGSLDLTALQAVVLDEADEMLDLGFRDDLEFILAAAPEERRTLMFSATVPSAIAQLAKRFQRSAVRISATSAGERHADIEYRQMLVPPADRENAIINALLYYDSQSTIIFCHTRESVKHLAARLGNRGFAVVALSGELSQAERTNALQSMRDGRARVCVATDVAARGIDLPNLDLVIHADIPSNPDTLLHRSGRTGRAGRKGVCLLVAPFHRRGVVARVLKLARLEAEITQAPTADMVDQKNRQRILEDQALSRPPTENEIAFVQELVAAHGAENLAAAYLRMQLASRPVPEDLMDAPIYPEREKKQRKERDANYTPDSEGPRDRADFVGGAWFRVTVGRKHRAEPRWLLPLICKAGEVGRKSIGAIRIFDAESQFEIAGPEAEAFAAAVKQNGTGEKGVNIQRIDRPRTDAPKPERGFDKRNGPRHDKPRGEKPHYDKPCYEKRDDRPDRSERPARADGPARSDRPDKAAKFGKPGGFNKPFAKKDGKSNDGFAKPFKKKPKKD